MMMTRPPVLPRSSLTEPMYLSNEEAKFPTVQYDIPETEYQGRAATVLLQRLSWKGVMRNTPLWQGTCLAGLWQIKLVRRRGATG